MKTVILGGGLAGLSSAYHLNRLGIGSTIFEKESEAGGLCKSINLRGFIFDHGPHLFFTRNRYVVELMYRLLEGNLGRKRSAAGQFSFRTYIGYPYLTNLYGLSRKIIEECIAGFKEVVKKEKNPQNYHEWCYQWYGKGFAKHFMIPYAKKVWTVDPKKMTFDWVGERIILPKLSDIRDGAYRCTHKLSNYIKYFRYPRKNGAMELPLAFLGKDIKIFYNKKLSGIDASKKTLYFSDGSNSSYDKLISTIPLDQLVFSMKTAPKRIKRYATLLNHTSLLCLCLGVDRAEINKKQWIYYDDPKIPFNRISFPSKIGFATAPPGKSSICVEIPYSRFRKINKRRAIEKSIDCLIDVGILKSRQEILVKGVMDIDYAYVIYDHKRKAAVNAILDNLRENDIFCAGRFGTWAYKWTHDAILDGKNVAKLIGRQRSE